MAAVKNGKPIPAGTPFVLVDHRDGKLYRYLSWREGADIRPEYLGERST